MTLCGAVSSVQICFPEGIPSEVEHIAPVDINNIQVPLSATPEGQETCIVDFYKKNAE